MVIQIRLLANMSVFSDFQRMWVQKFPESSLSDAWEQDVRQSLTRHRQRIAELQKELEQETLYVEYLERLLSDVEKFRESGGGGVQTLIEASTPTGAAAAAAAALNHNEDPQHPVSSTTKGSEGPAEAGAAESSTRGAEAEKSTNGVAEISPEELHVSAILRRRRFLLQYCTFAQFKFWFLLLAATISESGAFA